MKVMGNKSIYKYIILGFLEVCVILTVLLWAVQDENFMLEFYGADIASNVNPLVLERGSYSIEIDYETDLDNAVCYTMMTSVACSSLLGDYVDFAGGCGNLYAKNAFVDVNVCDQIVFPSSASFYWIPITNSIQDKCQKVRMPALLADFCM